MKNGELKLKLIKNRKIVKLTAGDKYIIFPSEKLEAVRTMLYYARAVTSEHGIDPDDTRAEITETPKKEQASK